MSKHKKLSSRDKLLRSLLIRRKSCNSIRPRGKRFTGRVSKSLLKKRLSCKKKVNDQIYKIKPRSTRKSSKQMGGKQSKRKSKSKPKRKPKRKSKSKPKSKSRKSKSKPKRKTKSKRKSKSKPKRKTKSKRKSKSKPKRKSKSKPKRKTKSKRKSKSKPKRKSKSKPKRKTKSKRKSKSKPKRKSKNKPKRKTKSKRKSKSKPKRKSKSKPKRKTKSKPKRKTKSKRKSKSKPESFLSEKELARTYEKLALASKRLYNEQSLKNFLNEYGKSKVINNEHHGIIVSLVDTSLSIDDRINRIMLLLKYVKKADYDQILTYTFDTSLDIYSGQNKRIGNALHNLIVKNNLQHIFKHPSVKRSLERNGLSIVDDKIIAL